MGSQSLATISLTPAVSDGHDRGGVHPALERVVRLAANTNSSATALLILKAGEELKVSIVYGDESLPFDVALEVARAAIDSGRHRFVCDEDEGGEVLFAAAEPIDDARDGMIGALCVMDPRSRSSSQEVRTVLSDLVVVSLPAVRETIGLIDSISPIERLFSFVVSTLDGINTGLFTPGEVMRLVIDQAVDLTSGFGAAVGLVKGDSVRYEAASASVEAWRGREVSMDKSHAGICIRTGQMILCRDTERDPNAAEYAHTECGARSLASVPLNYRSNTVGVLSVFARRVNAFGPTDVRILEQLAMLIAVSVEKSQSQQALRESEIRYQALLGQTADAIYFADLETGALLEANPAFFELLELDRSNLGKLTVFDFLDHEREQITSLFASLRSERHTSLERRWRTRTGRKIEVHATASVTSLNNRDVLVVVARDITENKASETRRRRTERKYRDLFERANVPIIIFRPEDEVILEANHQALIDYRLSREEMIGRSLKSLTADVGRGEVEMSHILAQGGTQNFETTHYRGDGTEVNLLVSCSLIDYEGSPAILMFGRDISVRKRAERLLSESEARFRAVTENAIDLIGIVDENARIRYMAGPVEDIVGYHSGDPRASIAVENIHPDDLPAVNQALKETLEHPERVISLVFRFRRQDGEWRDLSLKGRNLIDQPGVNGILISIRDVTERSQFEAELVEARDKAEEMARLKSAFLANMSHEIRTPLTAILGFADVLAREVKGEHREFVQLIQEGGRRLSETLNSVLDLARLEADGFRPTLQTTDVREAVTSVCELFAPMAEKKNLQLLVHQPDYPVKIEVDRVGVNRILQNLVSNAIKFTDEGEVTIGVSETGGEVLIEVRDTGRGIDAEFLPHLFDEFKQESTGLARSHEGTGLGLTITRRLVELMGGTIDVMSKRGVGSTFILSFPASTAEVDCSVDTPSSDATVQISTRPRVLVVEDNVYSRLLIERLLRQPYQTTTAANADEALALAQKETFDVVVMDINLGQGRDGISVMDELRREDRYRDVPMIALTAYAMPEDRERFLEAGFDEYLAKPFTRDELYEVLETVMAA